MRRKFVAGNWKMNLSRAEAVKLAQALVAQADKVKNADWAVCPAFVHLDAVAAVVKGTSLGLGAQNLYFEPNGAFTGEVSGEMLVDLGCRYVVLGHSERRHVLGESDADVNKKVKSALGLGLVPIVCVGETLAEREAGRTNDVVRSQFDGSLAGLTAEQVAGLVIAYEPVWAIGTGKVATPEQAEAVHADLRTLLTTRYNPAVAAQVRIQYGGSVKPDNAGQLLNQPNIDGALVGGASLKAESFLGILAAV